MYCVLSFRVTYLFDFNCSGVDAMGGGLKGINNGKIKYDKCMNTSKGPTSLEEAWKPIAVISMSSDNSVSEFNNDIVTEKDNSYDGSVKESSPSGM